MKTKTRYEHPLLVDMNRRTPCGEFASSCSTGSNHNRAGTCLSGSCPDQVNCYTGTATESCYTGNSACGCDACCGTGSSVDFSYGGWLIEECFCNSGATTGKSCTNGDHALSNNCFAGNIIYTNC